MKTQTKKYITSLLIATILMSSNCMCDAVYEDKQGRDVYEITAPTEEQSIDPDTMNYAIRHTPSGSKDYSESNYKGPSKNIFSSNTILPKETYDEEVKLYINSITNQNDKIVIDKYSGYTKIRHTQSIVNVDEDRYTISNDTKSDRIRLKIFLDSAGVIEAKNGFYKISGKTYYFDEKGLMVIGPAIDDIGNYYFFSYETGELLEEIPKR